MTPVGSHSLTHSSVTGSYLHITVQVTRDRHPVVFPHWVLPEEGYELGVADVTLTQFRALAGRLGRGLHSIDPQVSSQDLYEMVIRSMISLADALKVRLLPFEQNLIRDCAFLTCFCPFFLSRLFRGHSGYASRWLILLRISETDTPCDTISI